MTITPREFVEKWKHSNLREQQAAQSHFNDLCALVSHPSPASKDPLGEFFTFEKQVLKAGGSKGRADVWFKDHFAWEYKGKHKDLDAAYAQLLLYKDDLGNPPLLVVCDFDQYRIHPQWPNMDTAPFKFTNEDLLERRAQDYILWLLTSPDKFREVRQRERQQRERITRELADKFAHLADQMRNHRVDGTPVWNSMQIARFLTKLVFALFAEDIGLMPRPFDQPAFRYLTDGARSAPTHFVPEMQRLFEAMDGRQPGEEQFFVMKPTPYFNGGLFADSAPGADDGLEVLDLTQIPGAIDLLEEVSEADWREVDPTIFGTLFEGALDEGKRAQLGAHFTGESDIRLVVEPVLMQPLNRRWQAIKEQAAPLMEQVRQPETAPRDRTQAEQALRALHDDMMRELAGTRVLDPACGSGNFLYVSLLLMKNLEAEIRDYFAPLDLPFQDVVTPRQLYGIEKDPFAARLAHVVMWIGYLQWRYRREGQLIPWRKTSRPEARMLPNPILQDKSSPDEPDHILNDDAIMRYNADGSPYEPDWPEADVIMGNPPFLGGNKVRQELGDQYVDDLFELYEGRIPAFADLVCYWYEKARAQIETGKTSRVGLLATNSIRGGANREVLKRIKETGDLFMAWSDREWVLEGAAVRISIVGFDMGEEQEKSLDGVQVATINSDLTASDDITKAQHLAENENLCFMGPSPKGPFDIEEQLARKMLMSPNTNGKSNAEVIRPVVSGIDIVQGSRNKWTIDFGLMSLEEAAKYETPFAYVTEKVYPVRSQNRRAAYAEKWWQYAEARPGLRQAIRSLDRFIVTPTLASHRIFIWGEPKILYNQQVIIIARDDDYFFGVLHSTLHEIWSLRLGTWLGKGNDPRYTPTTTFETFPFPWPPGSEEAASPHYAAIADAARQLHEERDAWLNPPDDLLNGPAREKLLRERTLTNLYNALEAYRRSRSSPPRPEGEGQGVQPNNGPRKPPTAAQIFAPRLSQLHDALDRAVLAAYGWNDIHPVTALSPRPEGEGAGGEGFILRTPDGDEELLRRLLALNLHRAAS